MRLTNLTSENLAACKASIDQFLGYARGTPGVARLDAKLGGVTLEIVLEHDSAVFTVEGVKVVEPGRITMMLDHALAILGSTATETSLSATANRLHVRRRSGAMWVSGGVYAVIPAEPPAAPAPPPGADAPADNAGIEAPLQDNPDPTPDAPVVTEPAGTSSTTPSADPDDTSDQQTAVVDPEASSAAPASEVPEVTAASARAAELEGGTSLELMVDAPALKEGLRLARYPRCKGELPVLGTVRLVATPQGVELCGTDLETAVIVNLPALEVRGMGTFTRFLDRDSISVLTTGIRKKDRFTIRDSGSALEIDGPVGRMSVQNGFKADDWPFIPKPPAGPGTTVADLGPALEAVEIAATKDETRFAISAVLIEEDSVVATDGHRLHRHDISGKLPKMLLPLGKGLNVLKTLESPICTRDDKHAYFLAGNVVVISRIVEGTFPQYRKVVPKLEGKWHELPLTKVARELWIRKLNGLAVSSRTKSVRMTLNGRVEMRAEHIDSSTSSEASLEVALKRGGEVTVSINRDYLVDALSLEVEGLFVKDNETQLLLRGPRADVVIMPQHS